MHTHSSYCRKKEANWNTVTHILHSTGSQMSPSRPSTLLNSSENTANKAIEQLIKALNMCWAHATHVTSMWWAKQNTMMCGMIIAVNADHMCVHLCWHFPGTLSREFVRIFRPLWPQMSHSSHTTSENERKSKSKAEQWDSRLNLHYLV